MSHDSTYKSEMERAGVTAFCGVDWITLNIRLRENGSLGEVLQHIKRVMLNKGHIEKPWFSRYARGKRWGSLKMGSLTNNPKRTLVSVSGPMSQLLAMTVLEEGKATRVDLCVDMRYQETTRVVEEALMEDLEARSMATGKSADVTMYRNAGGGFTYYYGKRGKGIMLRVYDKGAKELGVPGMWIRYELEIGREYAERARRKLLGSEDVTKAIREVMLKYCIERNIPYLNLYSDEPSWLPSAAVVSESDDGQRMEAWFTSVVKPFMGRMIAHKGEEWVMEELGFGWYLGQNRLG